MRNFLLWLWPRRRRKIEESERTTEELVERIQRVDALANEYRELQEALLHR